MRVKMDTPISWEGKVTTVAELADAGKIDFKVSPNFTGQRGTRTAYFADIKGTKTGWEISATAYKSRTGKAVLFGVDDKPRTNTCYGCTPCVMCGGTGRIDAENNCSHCRR